MLNNKKYYHLLSPHKLYKSFKSNVILVLATLMSKSCDFNPNKYIRINRENIVIAKIQNHINIRSGYSRRQYLESKKKKNWIFKFVLVVVTSTF